ncbi:MAG TPA: lanthionine synthetase LanC family protein [Mycobacteriales bacterium]|jgi:hypothetical protein
MTAWAPLLDGAARSRAVALADAVAGALLAAPPTGGDVTPTWHGTLGAAVFLTAWGRFAGRADCAAAGAALLDAAVDAAAAQPPTVGLYGVPVGLAFAAAMLDPAGESDVDAFVANVVDRASWPGAHEVLYGLAGTGAYCLARLPRPPARRAVDAAVRHLANAAREEPDGVTWAYAPPPGGAFAFNEYRPEGHVNLGFAHGVPGIVAFLAGAAEAGAPGARELLAPAVRWLLAQRRPPGAGSAFAGFVFPGQDAPPARLAWCYGDPGVAVALLAAGRALGDGGVLDAAREVARGCAGRAPEEAEGATLCHGSAGLGHLFNRLGQGLGDERLLDLARYWFDVTVTRDAAGLTVVDRAAVTALLDAGATVTVDAGYGLLLGAAGAGLALLSAATAEPPWWDGPLLVTPFAGSAGSAGSAG